MSLKKHVQWGKLILTHDCSCLENIVSWVSKRNINTPSYVGSNASQDIHICLNFDDFDDLYICCEFAMKEHKVIYYI